jgi:hypothetical protein
MLPKFRRHQNYVAQIVSEPYYFYCVNFTEKSKIRNEMSVANSAFFSFQVKYCEKEERNDCNHDPLLINSQLAISISYIDNFVDGTNYTNPVQSYIIREVYLMSKSLCKILTLYFTNNEFVSDGGWLLDDIKQINYIQYSDRVLHSNMSKESGNLIYQAYFTSSRIRIKDKRVYLKIQELFARIGGIVNGFLILMTILSHNYLRFKYLIFVWKNIFNIIDEDYVISMKKQNNFLNTINKDNLK